MTTATSTTAPSRRPSSSAGPIRPIPTGRLVSIELRKMFDTRSGFWLMMSIVIAAVLATAAVIIFSPDDQISYAPFATAVAFPMAIVLPVIALLSVTSEWSQRSGLTTFTLVPHRNRVVLAKAIAAIAVGVVSMLLAFGIGVLGNLLGSAIKNVPTKWDVSLRELLYVVLANVLGLLIGFMLGVLIRHSAGAIVAYFVYSFVLPTLAGILSSVTSWFKDWQPWVDFNYAQEKLLFDGSLSGKEWASLGVTGLIWLVVPLALGVWLVLRSEVK